MDATVSPGVLLFLLLLGLVLIGLSRRVQRTTGLPQGDLLYADTTQWQRLNRPLFSQQHQLTGKPDYVIRQGQNLIPVEVKSSHAPAGGPYEAHVFQLAAYCLLIDHHYGVRPTHGLIQYANRAYTVQYTPDLEDDLLDLLDEMRADAEDDDVPRSHNSAARCRACGVRAGCDDRLA